MIQVKRTGMREYGMYMKALIVGPPGSGKTLTSSTWKNPIIASAEGGLMSIADRSTPYVEITSGEDLFQLKMLLENDPEIREEHLGFPVDTVIIDTIDEIQKILIRERLESTHNESMQLQDWGWLGEQMRAIIRGYRNLDLNVVMTCFAGETPVLTAQGLQRIDKLTDQTVSVLAKDGQWRDAEFSERGEQSLFEVEMVNGEKLYATAEHRWFATWDSGRADREVTTLDLPGRKIRITLPEKPERDGDFDCGVAHGIIFGDGSRHNNWSKSYIHLMGDDKGTLVRYLEPFAQSVKFHPGGAVSQKDGSSFNYTYVGGLPYEWKDLPVAKTRSYWYGFILGLLTTDGNVGKNVYIVNDDREVLSAIAEQATWVGFHVRSIKMARETSPYTGEYAPCYRLNFSLASVTEDEMMRPLHERLFRPAKIAELVMGVKAVRTTDRYESVYCCVEPVTHSFTVGSGMRTGNCHLKESTDSSTGRVYFVPALQGQIGDEIPAFVDLALLLKAQPETQIINEKAVRVVTRHLQTYPDAQHIWIKDRSGKLSPEVEINFQDDYQRLFDAIYGDLPALKEQEVVEIKVPEVEVVAIPVAAPVSEPTPVAVIEEKAKPVAKKATKAPVEEKDPIPDTPELKAKEAAIAAASDTIWCEACGGEVENQNQADLSKIRFRKVMCRSCFVEHKAKK